MDINYNNTILSLNITTVVDTGQSDYPTLSPMHKYFLVVLVLAIVNGILGLVYFLLTYKKKQKHWLPVAEEDPLRIRRRQSSEEQERQKRRKYSTHLVLAVGQNRESARRVSSVYL